MDIVVVNDYGSVQGGAAQVAIASARGLADAGYKVTYIFAVGPVDSLLLHKNIELVDLKQHDLLSNPSKINAALSGLWSQDVAKRMRKTLRNFNPEKTIIHIHSWVKALSGSVVSVCLESGFSTVVTLHDYFTACPNGGFYNYQSKSVCNLRPMSVACFSSNCDSRNYTQKVWRFARQIFMARAGIPNRLVNFIYVSEFSKKILECYLPSGAKFWNIPNPIDIKKRAPACPQNSNVFTYVGRFSPEKGVEVFAKASQQTGMISRFVGAGSLEKSLREICPTAEFTGWADREQIAQFIKDSRAIVFPSLLYETQGMVVVEAAALGVPCIVSDACAGRDFVENGVTGLWFEAGNVNSLAKIMNKLNENPYLASELGRNAYIRYWNDPPTLDAHVKALASCYVKMLSVRY